jgi:hypothetical protein
MISHPGAAQRREVFSSYAHAYARIACYAGLGNPFWMITHDCYFRRIANFPQWLIMAMAGHARVGTPGAAAGALWVTQNPVVVGLLLMPQNDATIAGLEEYSCV